MSSMATTTQAPLEVSISVEDYLAMSFDGPDAEYIDGVIVERPMPKRPHSRAQAVVTKTFMDLEQSRGVDTYPELRLRLGAATVRVPDVCVFRSPVEDDVPDAPPMLVVEIVSPSDVSSTLTAKLAEYHAWGVEHVWLIDPGRRQLAVYQGSARLYVDELTLPELGVRLTAKDLFDRQAV